MSFWKRIKDVGVASRVKDEEYHARAMAEVQSGMRRDGLWAKASMQARGDEQRARYIYIELLLQALKDEDYINLRSHELGEMQPARSQWRLEEDKKYIQPHAKLSDKFSNFIFGCIFLGVLGNAIFVILVGELGGASVVEFIYRPWWAIYGAISFLCGLFWSRFAK